MLSVCLVLRFACQPAIGHHLNLTSTSSNLTSFHVGSGQPSAFSFEEVVVEMVEGLEDPELRLAGFWHSHLALISGLEGRFTADFD